MGWNGIGSLILVPHSCQWTHIIMSDSDMGFNVNDLCQLVLADKDVIGAVAPVKAYPVATNASTGAGILKTEGDLNQCNYVGSGLLCIKRETIEVLYDKYEDSLSFYTGVTRVATKLLIFSRPLPMVATKLIQIFI